MPFSAQLSLTIDFDQRTEYEVRQKGFFECAYVTLPNGRKLPLSFWDPIRLSQELAATFEMGDSYWAEPCTIIVPEVTLEAMKNAVAKLSKGTYFDHFISEPASA